MAVKSSKMKLVLEDHALQKLKKMSKVKTLIRSDRRLTVRMIGSELHLNHQTIHNILTQNLRIWVFWKHLCEDGCKNSHGRAEGDICVCG